MNYFRLDGYSNAKRFDFEEPMGSSYGGVSATNADIKSAKDAIAEAAKMIAPAFLLATGVYAAKSLNARAVIQLTNPLKDVPPKLPQGYFRKPRRDTGNYTPQGTATTIKGIGKGKGKGKKNKDFKNYNEKKTQKNNNLNINPQRVATAKSSIKGIFTESKSQLISLREIQTRLPNIHPKSQKWTAEVAKTIHKQHQMTQKIVFTANAIQNAAIFFMTFAIMQHVNQGLAKKSRINQILHRVKENIIQHNQNINKKILSHFLYIKKEFVELVESDQSQYEENVEELLSAAHNELENTESLIIEMKTKLETEKLQSPTNANIAKCENQIIELENKVQRYRTHLSQIHGSIATMQNLIENTKNEIQDVMVQNLEKTLQIVNSKQLNTATDNLSISTSDKLQLAREIAYNVAAPLVGLFIAVASRRMNSAKLFLDTLKTMNLPEKAINLVSLFTSTVVGVAASESYKYAINPYMSEEDIHKEVHSMLDEYGIASDAPQAKANRSIVNFLISTLTKLTTSFAHQPLVSEIGGIVISSLIQSQVQPHTNQLASSSYSDEYIREGLEPLNFELKKMERLVEASVDQNVNSQITFIAIANDHRQHELANVETILEKTGKVFEETQKIKQEIDSTDFSESWLPRVFSRILD